MPDLHIVDHSKKLFQDFGSHFLDEKTADVVFVVEGEKLPAHRLMLASHCEFFQTLLFNKAFKEAQLEEIELKETAVHAFKIVLEYFYSGKINLEAFDYLEVVEVFELAHRYGLEALKEDVLKFLTLKVSYQNVHRALEVATVYEFKDLEYQCWIIIAMAVEGIYELDIVLKLEPQYFRKLLTFCKAKVSAIKLFRVALMLKNKWTENPQIHDKMKLEIKELIKFSRIPAQELFDEVQKSEIFDSTEFICLLKELVEKSCLEYVKLCDKNVFEEPSSTKLVKGSLNVVDLGKKLLINHIEFFLTGFCIYKIETSTDLIGWTAVFESFAVCYNQQNIYFPEIGAKYLKISKMSDEQLKQVHEGIIASYVSKPPHQISGFTWPTENIPSSSYFINTFDSNEKQWRSAENLAFTGTEDEKTSFISQNLSLQASDEHCFVVVLNHPYLLSSFRFRLWDFDGRKYSYKTKMRTGINKFEVVSDKTDELVGGWQEVHFSPRPVSDIYFYCIKTTIGDDFRMAYFQAPAKLNP